MTEQKLKPIIGYDNYLVSEYGIIIRLPYTDSDGKFREGRIISQKKDKSGYHSCFLVKNNKNHSHLIHRIVANVFIEESDLQVNHKDGDKSNNHYQNLEFVTDKENKEHAVNNNLHQKGSRNGKAKLTEKQVIEIKEMLSSKTYTQSHIAKKFKVSAYTISDINNEKTWKHIILTESAIKQIGL